MDLCQTLLLTLVYKDFATREKTCFKVNGGCWFQIYSQNIAYTSGF